MWNIYRIPACIYSHLCVVHTYKDACCKQTMSCKKKKKNIFKCLINAEACMLDYYKKKCLHIMKFNGGINWKKSVYSIIHIKIENIWLSFWWVFFIFLKNFNFKMVLLQWLFRGKHSYLVHIMDTLYVPNSTHCMKHTVHTVCT